ncbi:MAG: Na+/H+ antiporter NhaC family protein [Pseudomonadota bacterium]|nr:Na+/H+ antiporter NhaC family protein [Pseudomonadota bacterium]
MAIKFTIRGNQRNDLEDTAELPQKTLPLWVVALPLIGLIGLIVFGLILPPLISNTPPLALELVFLLAAFFAVLVLRMGGGPWSRLQNSIVERMQAAMPAFFILLFIGALIGSWMVCGTIPMLVYWGLQIVDPDYFYVTAFLVPVLFSSLTGTSYGSAATIGVVLIGIGAALGADLGITAGAIIGGAYFGDKLSPLSDTTNLAAIACDVDLYEHIHSMLYTTLPSAVLAGMIFFAVGWGGGDDFSVADSSQLENLLQGLTALFNFNVILLLPPLIVLAGSMLKQPSLPTLLLSIVVAILLALVFQTYSLHQVGESLKSGYNLSTMSGQGEMADSVVALVNRGGIYSMSEPLFIAFLVFFFIGTVDSVSAISRVIQSLLRWSDRPLTTALTALFSTGVVNAMTSNQYATSFIVGDAFRRKFDQVGIDRRVLSRSLEDYGTMIESLLPWTTTTLFMVATLGVAWSDYWQWQLLSLINLAVAPLMLVLGIGWFRDRL